MGTEGNSSSVGDHQHVKSQLEGVICRADTIGSRYRPDIASRKVPVLTDSKSKTSLRARKKFTKEYGRVVRRVQRFKEASEIRAGLTPTLSEKKMKEMDNNLSSIRNDILKTDIPALLRLAAGQRSFLCVVAAPSCEEDVEERKRMVQVLKSWVEDTGDLALSPSDRTDGSSSASEASSSCKPTYGAKQKNTLQSRSGQMYDSERSFSDGGLPHGQANSHNTTSSGVSADSPLTSPRKPDAEDIRRKAAQQERLHALQRREALRQKQNTGLRSDRTNEPLPQNPLEECAPSTPPQPNRTPEKGSSKSSAEQADLERPESSQNHPVADQQDQHHLQQQHPASAASSKPVESKTPAGGSPNQNSKVDGAQPQGESVNAVEAQVAAEAARRAEALKRSREQSQKAREELKRKQQEQQKRQSALWECAPDTTDSEVSACVSKLRAMKGEPAVFVDMIYRDYPPKDGREKYDRGNLKKTVQRAITHYHPDKQDEAAYGPDWITICDEICKELTRIYVKM